MRGADILRIAEVYARHRGVKLSTVGFWTVNDGKFFPRIDRGGDCRTRTAERVLAWFSAHWPADLEWPADIPRPARREEAA